jgi:hypothetical protein
VLIASAGSTESLGTISGNLIRMLSNFRCASMLFVPVTMAVAWSGMQLLSVSLTLEHVVCELILHAHDELHGGWSDDDIGE